MRENLRRLASHQNGAPQHNNSPLSVGRGGGRLGRQQSRKKTCANKRMILVRLFESFLFFCAGGRIAVISGSNTVHGIVPAHRATPAPAFSFSGATRISEGCSAGHVLVGWSSVCLCQRTTDICLLPSNGRGAISSFSSFDGRRNGWAEVGSHRHAIGIPHVP